MEHIYEGFKASMNEEHLCMHSLPFLKVSSMLGNQMKHTYSCRFKAFLTSHQ